MRIKVTVTQDDINNGHSVSASACPVAKAINRACDHRLYASVTYDKLYLRAPTGTVGFAAPKRVHDFVIKFDKGLKVHPFSFTLNLRKSHAETLGIPYAK